ncbi:MAG: flagellar assembly peptidoglycan hydrolase FlgJ [Gammaproteobacteria bacterium]|nr:flagellar assembly peptidoglycan hydrolase FlgJ [Gammaproteobacteria bacterium]
MSLNHLQHSLQNSFPEKATTDIYTDLKGLQNLKSSARKDSQAALPEVARQFEAVMISMMIKNMRKTGLEDPIFKSQAMDSYRDMYDQQLSMELSKGQGIGLAKSIVEQLQYQTGQKADQQSGEIKSAHQATLNMPQRRTFPDHYSPAPEKMMQEKNNLRNVQVTEQNQAPGDQNLDSEFNSPGQFVEKLWPLAEKAASKLGVTAEVILSQAALETGWGKHIISQQGKSSFNLFNIKANRDWPGERMETISMEFIHGRAVQQKSDFRAYDSYEQSFEDYVHFLKNNPRYDNVLEKMSKTEQSLHDDTYINALHKAGYATDPIYANKVLRVLNSDPIQNQKKLASK